MRLSDRPRVEAASQDDEVPEDATPASLGEIARLFSRLGFTAFGGPAAHIAMMENEVVTRRRWISHERFLDMMGAASLIPGPSSSELAIFIGYHQAGIPGLCVAGICFVLPAALMTAGLAWAYVRYGTLPRAIGISHAIKPVVIAIVVQAILGLAPKAVKNSGWLLALGAVAIVAAAFGVDALGVLVGSGVLAAVARVIARRRSPRPPMFLPSAVSLGASATKLGLGSLFFTFLKLGAVVFGSGYVLLAFLRADLVERLHWMTEAQLVDAVAVGQLTPGPVFTTATFIGYLLGGGWGALVATVAIFLPGFVLVAAIRPLLARVRKSPVMGAFLDGVNVASLALMAVVTVALGRAALVDWITVALAVSSGVLLVRFKVNSTWIILGAALTGLVVSTFR